MGLCVCVRVSACAGWGFDGAEGAIFCAGAELLNKTKGSCSSVTELVGVPMARPQAARSLVAEPGWN